MNLNKHSYFFNPVTDIKKPVHIIGCGAIGSHLAELVARLGIEDIHLYDPDTVEQKNIANQMFNENDVGRMKTAAIAQLIEDINPAAKITILEGRADKNTRLSGYVFLAVDSIDVRREIVEANQYNRTIEAMFDFRMRLTDAQHYAADWSNRDMIKNLLNTMQFSAEEAKAETPVNACGGTLSIIPTIKVITSLGISNFINFVKGKEIKKLILIDAFDYTIDAF